MTLDATPLLELIDRHGGITAVLHAAGISSRAPDGRRWRDSLRRVRRQGRVSPWLADRICVRLLGTLPELVYGSAFFDGCDDGEVAA